MRFAACGRAVGRHCDSRVRAEHDDSSNGNTASATGDQRAPEVTVLAGCLGRGSGAYEYALFGQMVQWWELKSDSANLGFYLDKEVRVGAVKSPENDGTPAGSSLDRDVLL